MSYNLEHKKNIWEIVGENFDHKLERLTAIIVKESDLTRYYTYPNEWNTLGYCFNFSDKTVYDNPAKFRIDFAGYVYPDLMKSSSKNYIVHDECKYYPSLIKRSFSFTNLGLKGTEQLGQTLEGALGWKIKLNCVNEGFQFDKKLITVMNSEEKFTVVKHSNCIEIVYSDIRYFIASKENIQIGLYENEQDMRRDFSLGKISFDLEEGYYLAISHDVKLSPGETVEISLGLSSVSKELVEKSACSGEIAESISLKWNEWFNSLPKLNYKNDREIKAYYKSWWTIRTNYYNHPKWGYSIVEALPVYKGLWQWAIPSVEWHSNQNTEYTSEWIKKAMDMLIESQREDGYITHAIYIDEEKPGERWAKGKGIVQTPHLPWTVVRYYNVTGDNESLKRWVEPLRKYYSYLCKSRDEDFEKLHLWAITTSYDTGLDTTPVFQKVTHGENGEKEEYCYPSIFAAERCRYEEAMGKIAEILGENSKAWYDEAEITLKAMNEYLWDKDKKWYGVRHQNGELDTRVGVDGLFPLAYHLVNENRANEMKDNFRKLTGTYGIRTVAEDEPGFREDIYWRGPAWPKSCSLGMEICRYYYNDLLEDAFNSVLNMVLSHPNIWECYNVRTGELGRSDMGFVCTPGVSSNVGAGDIIGSIFIYHGIDMYGMNNSYPQAEVANFLWKGSRITVVKSEEGWLVSQHKKSYV
jgi:hypothetical protein